LVLLAHVYPLRTHRKNSWKDSCLSWYVHIGVQGKPERSLFPSCATICICTIFKSWFLSIIFFPYPLTLDYSPREMFKYTGELMKPNVSFECIFASEKISSAIKARNCKLVVWNAVMLNSRIFQDLCTLFSCDFYIAIIIWIDLHNI